MVKRWDCTMGATVRETAEGEFVTYEDYATLEAKYSELREAAIKLEQANAGIAQLNGSMRSELAKLRAELERRAVDGWKLVPLEPTPEMVSAAEEAHMPFGDMDIALRMAILSAPSAPKADDSDADNYRWLREQHNNVNSDIGVYNGVNILATQEGELDLDAAIAAARQEGGK